ncbi:hypothetical protein QR685DRAFT_517025 [Neurospora intermedia]|uniref:Uncharacterized protein n=1 Tax=Neurospora intermedia TaxID=5142 RepID=A0ABR3DLG2_NEUIN
MTLVVYVYVTRINTHSLGLFVLRIPVPSPMDSDLHPFRFLFTMLYTQAKQGSASYQLVLGLLGPLGLLGNSCSTSSVGIALGRLSWLSWSSWLSCVSLDTLWEAWSSWLSWAGGSQDSVNGGDRAVSQASQELFFLLSSGFPFLPEVPGVAMGGWAPRCLLPYRVAKDGRTGVASMVGGQRRFLLEYLVCSQPFQVQKTQSVTCTARSHYILTQPRKSWIMTMRRKNAGPSSSSLSHKEQIICDRGRLERRRRRLRWWMAGWTPLSQA